MALSAFRDVIGNRRILDLLEEESSGAAQVYLFVGPESVGKSTVARRFAALLLCPLGSRHTQECERCLRVMAGRHPDLHIVDPEGKAMLGVEQARATVAQATLSPVEAVRKVFLFEEAGLLTDEAANALLKTLEEPAAGTHFLLLAEGEDELPPTVASRSRILHFGRVGEEEVAEGLVARGVDPAQAEDAARIAGGRPGFRRAWLEVPARVTSRPGDAVRLADVVLGSIEPLLAAMVERHEGEQAGLDADGVMGRAVRERHSREVRRAERALQVSGLEILASWYRDAAAAQFGAPIRNRDLPTAALATVSPSLAIARAERVLEAAEALRANQRPRLVLTALFAGLGAPD